MKAQIKTWFYRSVVAAATVAVLTSGTVAASDDTYSKDSSIARMVVYELKQIKLLEPKDVSVKVEEGVVTLSGTAPSLWVAQEAVKKTKKVKDVASVRDNLIISVPGVSDSEIAQQAVKSIRRYPFYTIFDNINVAVTNGVVTLQGQVSQPYRKTDMSRLVSQIRGVRGVSNDIEVLPVSFFDNELRAKISRAIYRDPLLRPYSLRADPPIHIIVKNGNVTLEGVVLTEVDKAVAERNARFAATYLNLQNNLRVEKTSASRG